MPHDDLDRDRMYASRDDDPEDDAELELEPIDPALTAAAEKRAAAAIEVHRKAIDINEVYRDFDSARDSEIFKEWTERLRHLRFQLGTTHLLILMAAVAVVIVLSLWVGFWTLLIISIMLSVAGLTLLLKLEENKRQEEADRRRHEIYAERRRQQARASGVSIDEGDD
jgi:hypothetical protein